MWEYEKCDATVVRPSQHDVTILVIDPDYEAIKMTFEDNLIPVEDFIKMDLTKLCLK